MVEGHTDQPCAWCPGGMLEQTWDGKRHHPASEYQPWRNRERSPSEPTTRFVSVRRLDRVVGLLASRIPAGVVGVLDVPPNMLAAFTRYLILLRTVSRVTGGTSKGTAIRRQELPYEISSEGPMGVTDVRARSRGGLDEIDEVYTVFEAYPFGYPKKY